MKHPCHTQCIGMAFLLLSSLSSCVNDQAANTASNVQPGSKVNYIAQNVLPELLALFKQQQNIILEEGRPLSSRQKKIATEIGIRKIEKIRILSTRTLPKLEGPFLTPWARKHRFTPNSSAAYTFGYGIIISERYSKNSALIAHELAHVRQMEELGVEEYLKRYLQELETYGYTRSPLEVEARKIERKYKK